MQIVLRTYGTEKSKERFFQDTKFEPFHDENNNNRCSFQLHK